MLQIQKKGRRYENNMYDYSIIFASVFTKVSLPTPVLSGSGSEGQNPKIQSQQSLPWRVCVFSSVTL